MKAVLAYAKSKYGAEPECPWIKFPHYSVLRHAHNRRWYAVLLAMVPKAKLGIHEEGSMDILNLKCDPQWIPLLRQEKGILPAYHMNKTHWITILLDGTASKELVQQLMDASYALTQDK